MFIVSQDRKFSLNASIVNWFHIDADHNVFARCGEKNEVLLGKYKTSDRAIDAMVAVLDALDTGKPYSMPADD